MKKRTLRIQPVIMFDLEPEESVEDAEERFLSILEAEGFIVPTYTSAIIEVEDDV